MAAKIPKHGERVTQSSLVVALEPFLDRGESQTANRHAGPNIALEQGYLLGKAIISIGGKKIERSGEKYVSKSNKKKRLGTDPETVVKNQRAIGQNSSLNLSNVNISFPQKPSRRSEVISQFSVISRIVNKGARQEDFFAEYEREIARRFNELKSDKQTEMYDELKREIASS